MKRLKRISKVVIVAFVFAYAMVFTFHPPHRMLARWSRMSGIAMEAVMVPSFEFTLDEGEAWAYNGPTGGNVGMGGPILCGDQIAAITSGTVVQAPCMANFQQCIVSYAGTGVPAAITLSCGPTTTATSRATTNSSGTATSTATTAPGFVINASTANATPAVNWWGGPR